MSSWKHKVIIHTSDYYDIIDGFPPVYYSIQEVHYDENNNIEYHSNDLIVEAETIKELKEELNMMMDALEENPINEIIED